MSFVIVFAYLAFMVGVGIVGFRSSRATPDDFFLAGRAVGPLVFFFTLIATNFSAFFFLGFAGAGYRIGYSYYGIMSFGTALVSVGFLLIGYKAWKLGTEHGFITPSELIEHRFRNAPLTLLYAGVMVLFTIPYLAIQPIGAGYLLSELTGGAVPYFGGAVLLTLCMVFYVFLGGMRSVALTDVVQGMLMLALMVLSVAFIASALGGFATANQRVLAEYPELFSRAGGDGYFTGRRWFSFMLLFLVSVPLFPQVFMRFFIPRKVPSITRAAVLYPLVTATLFLGPVVIGVFGRLTFPGLQGSESDQILPMMLAAHAPAWLGALVIVGALAAFMSTMDSQLLALSSIITRDLYVKHRDPKLNLAGQVRFGRVIVVVLAVIGLAVAFRPPDTIFDIATEAFTGLAVLFPTTIAALYWRGTSAAGCVASILVGQVLLIGYHYQWIPERLAFGFLPLVPILVTSTVVLVVVTKLQRSSGTMSVEP